MAAAAARGEVRSMARANQPHADRAFARPGCATSPRAPDHYRGYLGGELADPPHARRGRVGVPAGRHHELSGAGPGRRAHAVTAARILGVRCPGCCRRGPRAWRTARATASRWAWRCSSARWARPRACAVVCIIVVSSGAELTLVPRMPLRPGGADRANTQDLGL